jgi:hypothetical protein
LHCSKNEEAYSLAVLKELIEICRTEKVGGLFLAGDIFDSFQDAEAMRSFLAAWTGSPNPGRHYGLSRQGERQFFVFPPDKTRGIPLNKLIIQRYL